MHQSAIAGYHGNMLRTRVVSTTTERSVRQTMTEMCSESQNCNIWRTYGGWHWAIGRRQLADSTTAAQQQTFSRQQPSCIFLSTPYNTARKLSIKRSRPVVAHLLRTSRKAYYMFEEPTWYAIALFLCNGVRPQHETKLAAAAETHRARKGNRHTAREELAHVGVLS